MKNMENMILGENRVKSIKELCVEENLVWVESSYGGKRFGFKLSDEWKEKHSYLLKYKDENFHNNIFFSQPLLNNYFRMVTHNIIDKKIANTIKLTDDIVSILKNSYYDYDDEDSVITLESKRPFGNSDIKSDVMKHLKTKINGSFYDDVLYEIQKIMKDFFIYHPFDSFLELEYDRISIGKISNKYIRLKKINQLLE